MKYESIATWAPDLDPKLVEFVDQVADALDTARLGRTEPIWIAPLIAMAMIMNPDPGAMVSHNAWNLEAGDDWPRGFAALTYEDRDWRGRPKVYTIKLRIYPDLARAAQDYVAEISKNLVAGAFAKSHAVHDRVGLFGRRAWEVYTRKLFDLKTANRVIFLVDTLALWRYC